jgi:hypothetical protein
MTPNILFCTGIRHRVVCSGLLILPHIRCELHDFVLDFRFLVSFLDVETFSEVVLRRRFGKYDLHLHDLRLIQASSQHEVDSACLLCIAGCLFKPED